MKILAVYGKENGKIFFSVLMVTRGKLSQDTMHTPGCLCESDGLCLNENQYQ